MKIIIAGGGTAGWLTALYVLKKLPKQHEVVVIESSKLGIIGVGEGGTPFLGDIIRNVDCDFGIDGEEFTKETDAAMKMGIFHRNWKVRGEDYKAPLDFSPTHKQDNDAYLLHALENNIPFHLTTKLGWYWDQTKIPYSKVPSPTKNPDYYISEGHSYHFNTYLLGRYFKKIVCEAGGTYIDAVITEVSTNDNGIESLTLDSGEVLTGDLYVDCTGFSKALITKLTDNWLDYSENLPINRAMAFYLPVEKGQEIPLWTIAHALSSGWMWQIPILNRFGCGYVFCDKYLTDEQAQEEIEKELGTKIEPYKFIKFQSGRFDKGWNKNCVALGLSYSFVEPLEATSIHSTIIQIENLTEVISDKISIDEYNIRASKLLDAIKDFISAHYSGGRTDSEFWKNVKLTDFAQRMVDLSKTRLLTPDDIPAGKGHPQAFQYNMVLAGLGHITPELAKRTIDSLNIRDKMNKEWSEWSQARQDELDTCYTIEEWIKEVDLKFGDELLEKYKELKP